MSPLFDGFVNKVKSLIAPEESPLQIAAKNGDLEAVNKLLTEGADVNSHSFAFAVPPLAEAVRKGHAEIVRVLLEHNANLELGFNDVTPLELAMNNSKFDIAKLLIDKGANVNTKRTCPLQVACFYRDGELVDLLLAHGATYDRPKDQYGETLLHKSGCAAMLLPRGMGKPDINSRSESGQTPLHTVDKVDDCIQLVENGADVNKLDDKGMSPLALTCKNEIAAMIGSMNQQEVEEPIDKARYLIAKGADVNAAGREASTPLYEACHRGYLNLTQLLIDSGANVNGHSEKGEAPLCGAAEANSKEAIDLLCEKGADVNLKSGLSGETALHMAALSGCINAMEALLAHGADINAKTAEGAETPLHFGAQCLEEASADDTMRWLLAHGADPNIANSSGKKPYIDPKLRQS